MKILKIIKNDQIDIEIYSEKRTTFFLISLIIWAIDFVIASLYQRNARQIMTHELMAIAYFITSVRFEII